MSDPTDIVERLTIRARHACSPTPPSDVVMMKDAAAEIVQLRADMDQITGWIAGVDTMHPAEEAIARIDLLPSVQQAWERNLR
jgi:hypothetical protein